MFSARWSIQSLLVAILILHPGAADAFPLQSCGKVSATDHRSTINDLDDGNLTRLYTRILDETAILPGMAIGIVEDEHLVYAQGFGFADLEACSPSTPETGYYLLSTTKSFTGLLGALLSETGEIRLDQPLTDFIPDLTLPEPLNPGQVTVRQLLTHSQPFRNGGLNFRPSTEGELDRESTMAVLSKFSQPKEPSFEYSNLGYILAGVIFEVATGENWRDLLEKRVFLPLGMSRTTTSIDRARQSDFGLRYSLDEEGDFVPVPNKHDSQMNPAGGVVSTVNDLARWVIAELHEGRHLGEQVYPKVAVRQALAPQVQFDWTHYKFRRYAYGLGVHLSEYDGDLVVHHFGGGIHVSFMPEHKLGVIILTNNVTIGSVVTHRMAALTYDYLLQKESFEARVSQVLADARSSIGRIRQNWSGERRDVLARANPDDSRVAISDLTGAYASERLGTIEISQSGDHLVMRYGAAQSVMNRLDGNSFTLLFSEVDRGVPQVFDFYFRVTGEFVLEWDGRVFVRN